MTTVTHDVLEQAFNDAVRRSFWGGKGAEAFAETLRMADTALAEAPEDGALALLAARVWFVHAKAHLPEGRVSDDSMRRGLDAADRAVRLLPDDYEARLLRAKLLMEACEEPPETFMQAFTRSVGLVLPLTRARVKGADCVPLLRRALADCEAALGIFPGDGEALELRALALTAIAEANGPLHVDGADSARRAAAACAEALRVEPMARVRFARALALGLLGRAEEASGGDSVALLDASLDDWRSLRRCEPRDPEVHFEAAQHLVWRSEAEKDGRRARRFLQAARRACACAVRRAPDAALAWALQAKVLTDLASLRDERMIREAAESASRAIDLQPDLAVAWLHRAWAWCRLGRPDRGPSRMKSRFLKRALADFERCLELSPGERAADVGRVLLLYTLKREGEAAVEARRLVRARPDDGHLSEVLRMIVAAEGA